MYIYTFYLGYSDEEYETDPETKVRGPKPPKDGSEDSDVSVIIFITILIQSYLLNLDISVLYIIEAFITLFNGTFELFVF